MDVQRWIRHFEGNRGRLEADWRAPVTLPAEVKAPVAASLAIFQLGETGDGGTLRRYAARLRGRPGFEGYEEALDMFVKEENRHAATLAVMVRRLDGELIRKQWTAAVFKVMRRPLNLEFELQILLTAELLAEAYYEILRREIDDGPLRDACSRILKDEVGHT
ncbi:MAG: ferritin-like domain-containing protein, partial [Akkermansiaceae bacterium]|nr:ferritin-like domain-containing protein [Akkermansiaceae bacterium]